MLGPVVGRQATLGEKDKRIPAITKIHDFKFSEQGVTLRRCSQIGKGLYKELLPFNITTEYQANVMNEYQLEDGRPKNKASKPIIISKQNAKQTKQKKEKKEENLSMYEYVWTAYIQTWGMEMLQDSQPEVQTGGRILLEKMVLPIFPQSLVEVAEATKWSQLDLTLQSSLPVGYGLPVWVDGRNPVTKEAKAFVQNLFQKGQFP